MEIRPIETQYRGYRFRSRLEARWAVFFDALGLPFDYEPEGFELPGVGRYLPDFRLPTLNRWLEIKAPIASQSGQDWNRAKACAAALAAGTGSLVMVMFSCTSPEMRVGPEGSSAFQHWGMYVAPDGEMDGMQSFGWCSACESVTLGYLGGHYVHCEARYDFQGECAGKATSESAVMLAAFRAARSARFEYGEAG